MISKIIEQWEANKHKLEEHFKTTPQSKYTEYEVILKLIFELCITESFNGGGWAIEDRTTIDNGHYQGTMIFIIPNDNYHPSVEDYIMTDTYYGSCSGCDTLQAIGGYTDDLPTDEQVKDYMSLALHLVQKMKPLT